MPYIGYLDCCGIKEIANCQKATPERCLHEVWYEGISAAHLIFSHTARMKRYGDALAKYIVENKLGKVYLLPGTVNPNTGRMLFVWIYTPNMKAFEKWIKTQDCERDDDLW